MLTKIKPTYFSDHRGYFGETYSRRRYFEMGIGVDFVQDNHSLSHAVGTLRGLHFQAPPLAQGNWCAVGVGPSLMWRLIFAAEVQLTASGKVMS